MLLVSCAVPQWAWHVLEAATQCLVTIRWDGSSLSARPYDPYMAGRRRRDRKKEKERERKPPLDKLKRRQHMGEDGLACSKWPQGSHFSQCSNSPGSLVSICPLWAKVSETHCGHHGLEEIWQIQRSDPVCLSPSRGGRVASVILYMLRCRKSLLLSLEGCQTH